MYFYEEKFTFGIIRWISSFRMFV